MNWQQEYFETIKSFDVESKAHAYLSYYTAPTIEGIKPSCLVHVPKHLLSDENTYLTLTKTFQPLKFLPLKECNDRLLLLIYDEKLLTDTLSNSDIRQFLMNFGYQADASIYDDFHHLLGQFQTSGCPVEIGAFLGYPIDDVKAFAYEPMRPCLCRGYWTVYNQKDKAQAIFEEYDKAKHRVCSQIIEHYNQGGLVA